MSWAAVLNKNKDTKADFEVPQKVVYSCEPSLSEDQRKLVNADHETVDIHLPSFSKGLLILDANAIIKHVDSLGSIADALLTVPQVITEIRDHASRELLQRLSHIIAVLDPTQEAIKAVTECASRTGDLGVMSRTDIRLCALALDCCRVGHCLSDPIEPRSAQVNASQSARVVTEEVTDSDEDECTDEEGDTNTGEAASSPGTPSDGESEGEWITPDNLHHQNTQRERGETFDGGMACVTSDFAMQNTLLHLGVPIIGSRGMRIRELRLWLMRCTSCFTLVMDTTRQFCPDCGSGDTLRRVSYVVNANGEKQLFINFKKQISKRGTIYNLPRPRGGKRGTNRTLVLREDQLAQVIRGTSEMKMKERHVTLTESDELAAFGAAPKHKKRNLGQPKMFSSYHKYNINEKKKARAAHRK